MGKIVVAGYHALKLIHFYTCGPDEVRVRGSAATSLRLVLVTFDFTC